MSTTETGTTTVDRKHERRTEFSAELFAQSGPKATHFLLVCGLKKTIALARLKAANTACYDMNISDH